MRDLTVVLREKADSDLRLRMPFLAGGNVVNLRNFDTTGIMIFVRILRLRKLGRIVVFSASSVQDAVEQNEDKEFELNEG